MYKAHLVLNRMKHRMQLKFALFLKCLMKTLISSIIHLIFFYSAITTDKSNSN